MKKYLFEQTENRYQDRQYFNGIRKEGVDEKEYITEIMEVEKMEEIIHYFDIFNKNNNVHEEKEHLLTKAK